MVKLAALILCLSLTMHAAICQSLSIRGKVIDSGENKSLYHVSVLLLNKSDSILIGHTRTDKDGTFELKRITPGAYLVLVTFPSYADFVDELNIRDSTPLALPPINLVLKSKLLEAVVVKGSKGAMRIKGDTTEFNADSFRTQPGANVEDLLKKLPGIQIDKNGKITAQGETVQKVLVDGEEFFGDDPTLVTQNLRADMVDKVQVYDKKSDQAAFTGIDDGQRTKTINLKLKDDKKNGYFGRLTAGAGTDGHYDEQAMVNWFAKKRKVAAYTIISNTGKTGLNWQDRDNYGQSIAGMLDVDESGSVNFNGINFDDLDSWNGRYNGQGLPAVKTGGLHYSDKWNDERQTINANGKFMQLGIDDSSNVHSEYILPDTIYYNNQRQQSHNQILRYTGDLSYEFKFDSTSSLKVMADGGTDHKTINTATFAESRAIDSSLVNQNDRTISTVGDNSALNSNIFWRKKLPKKGRTVSVNVRENYTNTLGSGYLFSDTRFFSKGVFSHDSVTDQFKHYQTENGLLDSKVTYTEPLSPFSFVTANYGISLNNAHADRNSFNKAANKKYEQLDSIFSSDYRFNTFSNKGGLAYSLIKKQLRLTVGSNIGFTRFSQRDLRVDTSIERHFVNWYPQASFYYSFTQQRRWGISYNGGTVQPTLQQLQPVAVNEDPLNITVGNPGLKPQFISRLRMTFSDYKVLTDRSIFLNLSYATTQNAIANESDVDTSGRRISRSINVNGNYSLNGNLWYNLKWRKPDLRIQFNGEIDQNHNASVVNGLLNLTRSGTYSAGLGLYKSKEKKYDLELRFNANYYRSQSSVNSGITTDYWSYEINPTLDLFLPLKFEINADCDINLRQKTAVFTGNNNVALLNAWVGKKFLKNDAMLVKVSGNDILDQNIGFNRTINSNFISQNTYVSIKRYFMLSVSWNFNKAGTPAPPAR
ncbi:MAG: outer membrane beta-barrel protein [Bacteroidota bacterium]|nr:outer membrane beta-barrel protein [Bacteroidota bacterium]MDP4256440.1 outer membrane beta-barrel protein [Bacteroidota bacterium]